MAIESLPKSQLQSDKLSEVVSNLPEGDRLKHQTETLDSNDPFSHRHFQNIGVGTVPQPLPGGVS
jgi:hypothetical protein